VNEPAPTSSVSIARVWLAVLLTWLVPGAGHFLLGRRGKALLYFSLITSCFLLGLWMSDFRGVSLRNFELHFLAEMFYGGATLLALATTQQLILDSYNALLDVGVLYCSVAGLLNLCVMVDVYESAYPARHPSAEPAA